MSDYSIEFNDYSVDVKTALREKAIQFLYKAGILLRDATKENTKRKTSQTAGSWRMELDEGGLAVHVGSDFENALWEEFGTGIHSLKGNGRKGYWVFVEGSSSGRKSSKTYDLKGAKRAVAIMRRKGLNAYYTLGKEARRPFWNAYNYNKSEIERLAEDTFEEL